MEFVSVFFVVLSVLVLGYLAYLYKSGRRLPVIFELIFMGAYGFVLVGVLFPSVLDFFGRLLGISSVVNFVVYLSVFVAYFLIFVLYQKDEKQRIEITRLTREIALMRGKEKK